MITYQVEKYHEIQKEIQEWKTKLQFPIEKLYIFIFWRIL